MDPQSQNLPICIERQLGLGHVVTAVSVRHIGLSTRGGPFNRAADVHRTPSGDGFIGVVENFAAKAAANLGANDPILFSGIQEVKA